MPDKRDPESAAIRFLVDEFRDLKKFVESHCRDEEMSNQRLMSVITAISDKQDRTTNNQTAFIKDIEVMQSDLRDIKSDLKPITAKVAVHEKDIADAERDIQALYKMEGETRNMARWGGGGKKPEPSGMADFWTSDNFKYLIGGLILIAAIAWGVIDHDNVGDIVPKVGGE